MSGPPAILVDTFSATHGRPDEARNHRVHPIERSHSDLVKLANRYEEAYTTTAGYLQHIKLSHTGERV